MPKKIQPGKPLEVPSPGKKPEVPPEYVPEDPIMPGDDPEVIPYEDPFENPPPFEMPEPGEGP